MNVGPAQGWGNPSLCFRPINKCCLLLEYAKLKSFICSFFGSAINTPHVPKIAYSIFNASNIFLKKLHFKVHFRLIYILDSIFANERIVYNSLKDMGLVEHQKNKDMGRTGSALPFSDLEPACIYYIVPLLSD